MSKSVKKVSDFTIDGHPDELMKLDWIAWRLKIAKGTLVNRRARGDMILPEPVLVGSGKRPPQRWKRGVINAWIDGSNENAA